MSASDFEIPHPPVSSRAELCVAIGGLLVWIAIVGPLFLRMPLTNDTEVYDLQASAFESGSVLYRDFLEPNLPGVIWLHLLVRGGLGESSEAMRFFDLVMFAITTTLAGRLVAKAGGGMVAGVWTAFGMTAYYLTASEWCHCQRDVWMLCPALAAVSVRHSALGLTRSDTRFGVSFLEGLLWGAAVWLKPHVMIPAALVWLISVRKLPSRRHAILDVCGLLTGGLLAGALGIGWMVTVGCWEPFLETLREWNPAYFRAGRDHWTTARFVSMLVRQGPWCLFYVIALVGMTRILGNSATSIKAASTAAKSREIVIEMLAALFIGWTLQALFLQHLFDYVFAPTVLLAIIFVAANSTWSTAPRLRAVGYGLAFAALLVCTSPALQANRLSCWNDCWQRELSPAQRDRLAHFPNPDREDLAKIAEFLRDAHATDRDVCFYNSDFVSLYRKLGLLPPVRYTYFFETMQFFPQRRRELLHELQQSPHRFVVTDLVSVGMPRKDAEAVGPDGPHRPPPAYRRAPTEVYPWSCPVVYRAGTYLVHRVPTETTKLAERGLLEKHP